MGICIAFNLFRLLVIINTILQIDDPSETPIGPCGPSRADARTAHGIGVRPVFSKRRTDWTLGNTGHVYTVKDEQMGCEPKRRAGRDAAHMGCDMWA